MSNKKRKAKFIQANYDEVSKYKEQLSKIVENQNDKFDQTIIYISSGAFTITAFLIDKIVPLGKAISKKFLIGALSVFAITVVLALLAHFISTKANLWALENYESIEENKFSTIRKRYNCAIDLINYLNIFLLILGCVFLLYFMNINL